MPKKNHFQFRQFGITQEKSGMKVGTDGVLLGAWAQAENAKRILDIGTGTGLIAIMMAQKSKSRITGVEIEPEAAKEARFNVTNSPWSERIEIVHSSVQDYLMSDPGLFDLIITNPPFFDAGRGLAAQGSKRKLARQADQLSFEDLIEAVVRLLSERGCLYIVLPLVEFQKFQEMASNKKLYPNHKVYVSPRRGSPVNRVLAKFTHLDSGLIEECMSVYNDRGDGRSDEFQHMSQAYYL